MVVSRWCLLEVCPAPVNTAVRVLDILHGQVGQVVIKVEAASVSKSSIRPLFGKLVGI